jgi:methyl-accepting chemotaxis protein
MSETAPTSPAPRPPRFAWRPAGAAATGVLVAMATWQWAGLSAALGWTALVALLAGLWPAATQTARPTPSTDDGALRLQRSVVPIWQRNITAAREHAEHSMQTLVENFANVLGLLEQAVQAHGRAAPLQLDNFDAELARHQPELERLLSTTRLAVGLKDRMLDGVEALDATLQEMAVLIREVQGISRATHLLALNASVEATRASANGGGFAVVAQEVRRLAADARRAGMQLGRHVEQAQARLQSLRKEARRHDTDEDEIVLQAEENARAVLRALLGSVGEAGRVTQALQQTSRSVQDDLERILMSLQSQDRLAQMLTAVTDDMTRMGRWLDGSDDPLAQSPPRWLDRLEQSYTMESQRSSHHGTVAIDKQAAVEFF